MDDKKKHNFTHGVKTETSHTAILSTPGGLDSSVPNEKVGQASGLFPSLFVSNCFQDFQFSGEEFCLFQTVRNEMKLIEPAECKA